MVDLRRREAGELAELPFLWLNTDGALDPGIQEKLLHYAESGGHVVLEGLPPAVDWQGRPAGQIMAALGAAPGPPDRYSAARGARFVKVVTGGEEIGVGTQVRSLRQSGQVLAETLDGEPAVVRTPLGRGSITIMPFHIVPGLLAQADFVRSILAAAGLAPHIRAEKLCGVVFRLTDGGIRAVFLNYHGEEMSEGVTILGRPLALSMMARSIAVVDPAGGGSIVQP